MNSPAQSLGNDPVELRAEVLQLRALVEEKEHALAEKDQTITQKAQRIEQLLDYILLLRKRQFGARADRPNKDQLNLFDEAELEHLVAELEQVASPVEAKPAAKEKGTQERNKPIRRPLPAHLNRVEKIIDFSAQDKAAMGEDWRFIGFDTSEQLAIIPRQYYVIEYKRAKYVANSDEAAGAEQGVRIAPRADQIIPKSTAHSWVMQLHERLSPLMAAMKGLLYQGRVIQIDETHLQVLNEPGRENTQRSYMWVYGGGPPDKPVIWYHYAETRSGQVPEDFLYPQGEDPPEAAMYLLSDGYGGYNALCQHPGILGHAACWAHVRRKFVEATHGRKNTAAAHQMVALIGKLYQIERRAREKTPAQRQALRQEQAVPILDKIKQWLDQKAEHVLPKSPLGKAIAYTLELWSKLTTYLEDGHIEIDNNKVENAIRPFAVGRKNFLFFASPRGAHASATLYTLVETAKANSLEPWAYLNYLFEKLPCAKSQHALVALLPQNLKMEDLKS